MSKAEDRLPEAEADLLPDRNSSIGGFLCSHCEMAAEQNSVKAQPRAVCGRMVVGKIVRT